MRDPVSPSPLTDLLQLDDRSRSAWLAAHSDPEATLIELAEQVARLIIDDLGRAIDVTQSLVALADEHGVGRARSCTRRVAAQALAYANRHDEALAMATAAVELAEAAHAPVDAARARMAMMQVLDRLGRGVESMQVGQQARAAFMEAGEDELAARAEANLGIGHRLRNEPREALGCFDRARAVLGGDPVVAAQIDSNRAEVLLELNEFDAAEAAFRAAFQAFDAAGVRRGAGIAEGNLADLLARQGRLRESLYHFEHARRTLDDGSAPGDLARLTCEQAEVFASAGLAGIAELTFAGAIAVLDEHDLRLESARARVGYGRLLLRRGEIPGATEALRRATETFDQLSHAVSAAHARIAAGELAFAADQREDAVAHWSAALNALRDRPVDAAHVRHHLAVAALANGDLDDAETHVTAGLAAVTVADVAPRLADLLHVRAGVREARGEDDAALEDLREAVRQIDRVRGSLQAERLRAAFLGDRTAAFDDLVLALVKRGDPASLQEAFKVAEQARSRALLDIVAGVLDPDIESPHSDGDRAAQRLASEVASQRRRLNALFARLDDPDSGIDAEWSAQLAETEAALDAAEGRLAASRTGGAAVVAPGSVDDVQRVSNASTAVVSYYVARERVLALVLNAGEIAAVDLGPRSSIATAIEDLQFQLRRAVAWIGSGRDAAPLAAEAREDLVVLHDLIFAPLLIHLAGAERLLIVPHGMLHAAPFAALFDGRRHLIETHEILAAPSVGLLRYLRPAAVPRHAMVVGAPDADAPMIGEEASRIAGILDADTVLIDRDATAAAVVASSGRADLVHLACHARFLPETPDASGVRLADGWMTVDQIARLRLNGATVVLSGCHTGRQAVGGADELVGLVRGLTVGGAGTIVASLWAVEDASAADLMSRVYQRWREDEDASLPAAFRAACREAIERGAHVVQWAPFVIIGPPG